MLICWWKIESKVKYGTSLNSLYYEDLMLILFGCLLLLPFQQRKRILPSFPQDRPLWGLVFCRLKGFVAPFVRRSLRVLPCTFCFRLVKYLTGMPTHTHVYDWGTHTYLYLSCVSLVDADDSAKIYDNRNAKFYRCQRNINYPEPKLEADDRKAVEADI